MLKYRLFQPQIEEQVLEIPYLPRQIDSDKLHKNGKLLPSAEIDRIKAVFDQKNAETAVELPSKHSKKKLNTDYSILKIDGKYFAVYEGMKKGKALGDGSYGRVKIVQDLDKGSWHALKIQTSAHALGVEEYETLKSLQQTTPFPFGYRKSSSKKENQYVIIMNLAQGISLAHFLDTEEDDLTGKRPIPSVLRLQLAINFLRAIKKLHVDHSLLHRDLKPSNVICNLLTGDVTLVDFGFAKKMQNGQYRGTLVGSAFYLDPLLENLMLLCQRKQMTSREAANYALYDGKSEVYAAGMTLASLFGLLNWKLACLHPLRFRRPRLLTTIHPRFLANKTISEPWPAQTILKAIVKAISGMLLTDRTSRSSIDNALSDFEMIRQAYLTKNTNARATAIKVGVIDVNYCLTLTTDKEEALLLALQAFDEIWFADASVNPKLPFYVWLKRFIEEKGKVVGDRVFMGGDHDQIITKIQTYLYHHREIPYHCEWVNLPTLKPAFGKTSHL